MTVIVTAAAVREFFRADEKRMARLSPEAAKTVAEGARGRLHPEVIKAFNKGRKNQYVLGANAKVKAERANARIAAEVAGFKVGARGPLPREARVALGMEKPAKTAKTKAKAAKK